MQMPTIAPVAVHFDQPTDDADLLAARIGRTRFLDVPERPLFMIDGHGAPGGASFQAAFGALYPVAYAVHFAQKRRGVTAKVGALEGLYWFGDAEGPITSGEFGEQDASAWNWRLLLPVPRAATTDEIQAAFGEVARRKAPEALHLLRVERWAEGPAAQTLHVGPYATETVTIAALRDALDQARLRPRGCHHEIYLSDPNRTAPERLRTIIRQPVEPATMVP